MFKRKVAASLVVVSLIAPLAAPPASAGPFLDIGKKAFGVVVDFVGGATEAVGEFLGIDTLKQMGEGAQCLNTYSRLEDNVKDVGRTGALSLEAGKPLKVTARAGGLYPLAVPWVLSPAAYRVERDTMTINDKCEGIKTRMTPIKDIIRYSTLTVKGHPWVTVGLDQNLRVTVPEGTTPDTYIIPVEITETTGYEYEGGTGTVLHHLTLEVTVEPGEPEPQDKAKLTGSSDFFNIFSMFSS